MREINPYFSHIRSEIHPLLPKSFKRVLEVGCGAGETLVWLKSMQSSCEWIGGVELSNNLSEQLSRRLDWSKVGNVEEMELDIEESSLDLILCLDVLEHLVDPWALVYKLTKLLKQGGSMISSIPNVRNFRVMAPLFFKGEWSYQEEGILDKTHLRFFTKKTAIELMESSGMILEEIKTTGLEKGRKENLLNSLSLGFFKEYLIYQYIIKVSRY